VYAPLEAECAEVAVDAEAETVQSAV
jgi:hypothetical protein